MFVVFYDTAQSFAFARQPQPDFRPEEPEIGLTRNANLVVGIPRMIRIGCALPSWAYSRPYTKFHQGIGQIRRKHFACCGRCDTTFLDTTIAVEIRTKQITECIIR